MDLNPEGFFRDDSDSDDEFYQEKEASKELVVYLVDASPKMFSPVSTDSCILAEAIFMTSPPLVHFKGNSQSKLCRQHCGISGFLCAELHPSSNNQQQHQGQSAG